MEIDDDPAKRAATPEARGLDMARAGEVFADLHLIIEDDRQDHGEPRSSPVVLAWTLRGSARRVMSTRKANERERQKYGRRLG